jgi:hypothetical protein
VAVAFWSNSKRVLPLAVAVLCCVLAAGVFLLEAVLVTPAEEVEALVVRLCDQFRRKDPATLNHFSNAAPELRGLCETAMDLVEIEDDLRLTDFQTRVTNEDTRAITHFRANATLRVNGFGNVGRQPARIELTWAKEGNGWKIIALRRLNPVKDEEMPVLSQTPH